MEARAHLRYARIAPRKVSVVLDLIRGEDLDKALAILQYTPKAASELLYKLVKSAAANAENNHNMDKNNLYVAECFVTPGPTLKRVMPRAQGRACGLTDAGGEGDVGGDRRIGGGMDHAHCHRFEVVGEPRQVGLVADDAERLAVDIRSAVQVITHSWSPCGWSSGSWFPRGRPPRKLFPRNG